MTAPTVEAPARTEPETLAEFDFAKPCEGHNQGKPCPREATWMVWFKHDPRRTCPLDIFMCDEHKDSAVMIWQHMLTCPNHGPCPRCGPVDGQFHGQLDEFIRAIKL